MNLFLKAKHWQLFLVLVVIPIVTIIGFIINFVLKIIPKIQSNDFGNNPFEIFEGMTSEIIFFSIVVLICTFISYLWYWAVANNLQKKLPERLKVDTTKFKIFFFIYISCTILLNVFGFIIMKDIFESGIDIETLSSSNINRFSSILNILQLVIFGFYFYIVFFVAKVIKTLELKKETKIGDFAVEIFFIIFFFIGVWILQPRINKIFNNELEKDLSLEDNLVV